jgi:uncharacterized protein with PIN domain
MLGLDAAFIPDADDNYLRYLCRSEGRLLLTRDKQLAQLLGEGAFLVSGDDVEEEFSSIASFLKEKIENLEALTPLSRCLECNGRLEALTPEEARGKVPDHVHRNQTEFRHCSSCNKVYWSGSHSASMEKTVEKMLALLVNGE